MKQQLDFPKAVHFNQSDHSLKNMRCVILRGDIETTADRLICEQTFIHKLKTHSKGVNQDLSFFSPLLSPVMTTFNFYVCQQHRSLTSKTELRFFIFAFTANTPLRKDTGVFENIGRFIIILLD